MYGPSRGIVSPNYSRGKDWLGKKSVFLSLLVSRATASREQCRCKELGSQVAISNQLLSEFPASEDQNGELNHMPTAPCGTINRTGKCSIYLEGHNNIIMKSPNHAEVVCIL